jgi:AcrR family transcriptional regulator
VTAEINADWPAPSGPTARRSRTERTADSRTLILDAAVACLAEEGYAATTTLSIQARAGVSRGRMLHHFPSRDALLVAAAQYLAGTRMADMELMVARSIHAITDETARLNRATELLWEQFRQPYFWAAMELWTAARTHPTLRQELGPAEYRLGRAIQSVIATMYGPTLSSHPQFPLMRDLLFTSMRGVAMTYTFTENDPAEDRHLAQWLRIAEIVLNVPSPTHQNGAT